MISLGIFFVGVCANFQETFLEENSNQVGLNLQNQNKELEKLLLEIVSLQKEDHDRSILECGENNEKYFNEAREIEEIIEKYQINLLNLKDIDELNKESEEIQKKINEFNDKITEAQQSIVESQLDSLELQKLYEKNKKELEDSIQMLSIVGVIKAESLNNLISVKGSQTNQNLFVTQQKTAENYQISLISLILNDLSTRNSQIFREIHEIEQQKSKFKEKLEMLNSELNAVEQLTFNLTMFCNKNVKISEKIQHFAELLKIL